VCRLDSRVRGSYSFGYFGYIEDELLGNNNLIKSKLAAGSLIPSPRPIGDLIVTSAAPPQNDEKGNVLQKLQGPAELMLAHVATNLTHALQMIEDQHFQQRRAG
jgi:hypothetical protein